MILCFEQSVIRTLKKVDVLLRKKILDALSILSKSENPTREKNVKKVVGAPSSWYRLKHNNYRIIFDIDGNILHILHIRKRNEKTYKNLS